jgi:filamentous hemagglutinin family protein
VTYIALVTLFCCLFRRDVMANPKGGTVSQGRATITSQGPRLTIQASDRSVINWQSFNIGVGEITTFIQPSASSIVWNRIYDSNPSQILGSLNANGYVVLQNQSGFFIGGQAAISTRGLVLTTAPLRMPDLTSSGPWEFNAPPPTAKIINYGQINVGQGGSAFLIAHDIENHGTISAPGGRIGLYAGQDVLLSDRPDGRGLSATVTLPEGSVDNSGNLIADAGTIAMHAKVVNQGGLVQANSVRNLNGVIELVASDEVNLGANSRIEAKGGDQGVSPGGSVLIKSNNKFSDEPGSRIDISGGAQGGNGGHTEISATHMTSIESTIDGSAARGFVKGRLLIDPLNITISDDGGPFPDSGVVGENDPPSDDTLYLNPAAFFPTLSQVVLQATGNIELATRWSLADRNGVPCSLSLQAGQNITLDDGSALIGGRNWSISMVAGGYIHLDGSSFIQTQNGSINLWAGSEVIVNSGAIRTKNGGSIMVTARDGDVNAGTSDEGYSQYRNRFPYYLVSDNLGGISTAAGGDITINAGGDVHANLPQDSSESGVGAFGPQAGNVSVNAGGSIYGHYLVANGVGTLVAGHNAGGPGEDLPNIALSVIKGGWNVSALSGSIYLQEVRNPNGVFNNYLGTTSPAYHLFDYDPEAFVNLTAQRGVYLTGNNLPRPNGSVPMIFPSIFSVNAGGLVLQDTVILFPSPYSGLSIVTHAVHRPNPDPLADPVGSSGDFVVRPNNPANPPPELIMSDSSQTRWLTAGDFADYDHSAAAPVFLNTAPVVVDVGHNMEDVILTTTKRTQITVGNDMNNCSFSGQNLSARDVTSITVGGRIFNESAYNFVSLPGALPTVPVVDRPPSSLVAWDTVLALAMDPAKLATLTVPANLPRSKWAAYAAAQAALFPGGNPGFVYNPVTHKLGFGGQMSDSIRDSLMKSLTVLRYGLDGYPVLDSRGHFVTDRVSFANADTISALHDATVGAPSPSTPTGYVVGGPGTFNVTARSIALGNSYGIISGGVGDPLGKGRYENLASLTPKGASINVTITGPDYKDPTDPTGAMLSSLDMRTASIAALGGGDVTVNSILGSMDLGSQELFNIRRSLALGVYTTGGRGYVNVTALGDIDINGSRIAAYNGGNIFIESFTGDVNAGSGGTFFVPVPVYYVNPRTHRAGFVGELVFGSGILATTLVNPGQVPGSPSLPGDITVLTPQGSIFASQGGILQDALNGNIGPGPRISLVAGTPAAPGAPGYKGDINLGDSGVIGGTVDLQANGDINGLVISRQNSTINAAQSFVGTVLSGGSANLSAGGTIAGTVIGVSGVQASSGQGITASLLSQNVSVAGGQSQSTLGTTATATSTSQAAASTATADARQQVLGEASEEDDKKKKKGAAPTLARRVGRVTVILPKS